MIRELPIGAWPSFLQQFGREHRAWLMTIHILDRQHGVARFTEMPLQSATLAGDAIRFDFLDHEYGVCARHPVAARTQETTTGAVVALEIETLSGRFIRLAFRATGQPELLDGVAPGELVVQHGPRTSRECEAQPAVCNS